jgi:hypothetical protein
MLFLCLNNLEMRIFVASGLSAHGSSFLMFMTIVFISFSLDNFILVI